MAEDRNAGAPEEDWPLLEKWRPSSGMAEDRNLLIPAIAGIYVAAVGPLVVFSEDPTFP